MFSSKDLKSRFDRVSAKTLSVGARQYLRSVSEYKTKDLAAFTYSPLTGPRCIRLLHIQAGGDTDALTCDVSEVDLDAEPIFEALSYTWDQDHAWDNEPEPESERKRKPILCNGQSCEVTMNLYHALTEFRRRKMYSPIWIDQICINQKDDQEKNLQLGLMAEIYRSAVRVIVWLGIMSKTRNSALDFLLALPPLPEIDQLRRSKSVPMVAEETDMSAPSQLPARPKMSKISRSFDVINTVSNVLSEQYHWLGVLRLLRRSWFNRTWTLQELLLAQDLLIMMGDRDIPPAVLADASKRVVDFYANDPLMFSEGVGRDIIDRHRYMDRIPAFFKAKEDFKQGKRFTAEDYLSTIRVRGVTNPRDKVIAGKAILEHDVVPVADFDAPTANIFINFAHVLYEDTGVFSLSLVGDTAPAIAGLPSWVPDLVRPLRPTPLKYCGCSSFDSPIPVQGNDIRFEDKTIHLRGAKWDVVRDIGETSWSWEYSLWYFIPYDKPPVPMRTCWTDNKERFGDIFPVLEQMGPIYKPTGERTADAFWKTLIGNIQSQSANDDEAWGESFRLYLSFSLWQIRQLAQHKDNPIIKLVDGSDKWLPSIVTDAIEALEHRLALYMALDEVQHDETNTPRTSLRQTILDFARRIFGTENLSELSAWKGYKAETSSALHDKGLYEQVQLFGNAFTQVYDGRRILVSEKGYMGIAPESVKVGDVIFLVAGAGTPYVFRPVKDVENTYTLVGEAYLHGLTPDIVSAEGEWKVESITVI
ncbi:HET-domain-containing protein [Pseudovirgaria hyperparasitica]|uniref:HET-domain-containing protein n=1 Tax=Pseudovirgaria hyperparasitica TaxID=470096 RepID=A0A6A6VUC5_9PEZI|nr:HET-domain-containing protein [Pseudovirgaria hyperparasitica]KAF2753755.1 HET-domain-containing protein [Pseudovirgaria hyperparasitica]